MITDDDLVEGAQWFTATLTSTSDNVNIGVSVANITILDCKINNNITQYGSTVYIGMAMGGSAL